VQAAIFHGAGQKLTIETVPDLAQRVVELAGAAAAIVFDCVGVPGSQQLAMHYARVDGRAVIVGCA
jgi:threonine dehydrogenase-like Zn-dependent dehydrogenase